MFSNIQKYWYFTATDESWFYLDGSRGKSKVCYIKKSDPNYDRMIIRQDISRSEGIMVWGGVSSKGKTTLRFVEPSAKINLTYYVYNILQPFLLKHVPRLFQKKRKNKVVFSSGLGTKSYIQRNNRIFKKMQI